MSRQHANNKGKMQLVGRQRSRGRLTVDPEAAISTAVFGSPGLLLGILLAQKSQTCQVACNKSIQILPAQVPMMHIPVGAEESAGHTACLTAMDPLP
jgi:hypothetical protein